jgi:outer membrane protein OmpA-like peptidoglycan-associated protein
MPAFRFGSVVTPLLVIAAGTLLAAFRCEAQSVDQTQSQSAPPTTMYEARMVFFDFGKANLSEKAVEVVQEVVKTAKREHFAKITVTGYTDSAGSDAYNQALSLRRAQAVKDEMVREGVDANSIVIDGKGSHELLVPTGPGVREPQNRRAVLG